jgi:RNA polymerase sigma factor for flagellar operon FliA
MNYDKETLIMSHMDLAKSVAKSEWRTATHALHLDDMESLALEGLVDAADRWEAYCIKKNFDPAATQYFKVFARLRIRGNIRDQLRKDDWTTRTVRTKSKKLKDAGQDEGISVEELAVRTEMTVQEINKVNARLAQRPVSLDGRLAIKDDMNPSETELQIREDVDTEGTAFANEMLEVFTQTIRMLDESSQIVIVLHYYSKLDLRRIAEELDLTESRVSQLHSKGVLAVKEALMRAAQENI